MELRYPNIKGKTEREQLAEVKSYLHQLVGELQFALNSVNSSGASSYVVSQPPKTSAPAPSAPSFDAEVAFDALKPLIIKSAEIVQAYYEEINSRLEGIYVAESDFGTFMEQTEQSISQNSTGIEQAFTNMQQIITDIENLNFTLAEVNAHIKSGLLYYDENEIPVYGLEIGQKNTIDGEEVFNKYARFTSDRLSFYDQNDTEVAYISDYKLYIRNVEITSSYKIGGFVDTVMANGDVVTKWVGGDS
jgi:hypothetical protein